MIKKIVSGGQTGADRAALDVALELGIPIGGWVPRGRRAEDGPIPERYTGLNETESDSYEERTERNVNDSDATVIFSFGPLTGGSALTASLARMAQKPYLVLDLKTSTRKEVTTALQKWIENIRPRILNVAGPRLSKEPRITKAVASILRGVLRPCQKPSD